MKLNCIKNLCTKMIAFTLSLILLFNLVPQMVTPAFAAEADSPRIADGIYSLSPQIAVGSCLDVKGGKTANGTNIQIYQSNGTSAQYFHFIPLSNGFYKIASTLNESKVLDVAGGSNASKANVQLYQSNNTNAQQWKIQDAGNGYFTIRPRTNTNLCLDVSNGSTSDGTNIWVYSSNGTGAQKWKITGENGKAVSSTVNYSCANFSDCTSNGGDIYIVTKNNAPIRKASNNKGEIVAYAKLNELVSVKRIFTTSKNTKWAEINVDGGSSLYIYTGNIKAHKTHTFISSAQTDAGIIEFCGECGYAQAVTANKMATCNLACVMNHAALGEFSTEENSFFSVAAEVLVGEIPIIGSAADIRDIIGSIAMKKSIFEIALNCAALLPLVGMFKYSDEIGLIGKHADDIADSAKKVSKIPWLKWSEYPKVSMNGKEYAKIGDFYYTEHAVSGFLNPSIQTNYIRQQQFSYLQGAWKGLTEHSRGVPPSYVNYILTEGVENGTTKIAKEAGEGLNRYRYTSGTVDVIVEDVNKIVTIITH